MSLGEVCSFCSRSVDLVGEMVSGSHVNLCNQCVDGARALVIQTGGDALQTFPEPCSFCRQTLTRTQFRGQHARICEDCIVMATDIISEQRASKRLPQARLVKG